MKKLLQVLILFCTFQLFQAFAVSDFPNLPATIAAIIGRYINLILSSITNFRPCITAALHDIENTVSVAFSSWKHCLVDFLEDSKSTVLEFEGLVIDTTKNGFDVYLYCLNMDTFNETVSCTKEVTFKTVQVILTSPEEVLNTFEDFTDRIASLNDCASKNSTALFTEIDNIFYNIKSCVIKGYIYQKLQTYG